MPRRGAFRRLRGSMPATWLSSSTGTGHRRYQHCCARQPLHSTADHWRGPCEEPMPSAARPGPARPSLHMITRAGSSCSRTRRVRSVGPGEVRAGSKPPAAMRGIAPAACGRRGHRPAGLLRGAATAPTWDTMVRWRRAANRRRRGARSALALAGTRFWSVTFVHEHA